MFERNTERARRVIFFARHEASHCGSTTIETEHILMGLLRVDEKLIDRFVPRQSGRLREELELRIKKQEIVSTVIDLPLSPACKNILAHAGNEAEGFGDRHVGTEHLLLGVLDEEKCLAAVLLRECEADAETIRKELHMHKKVNDPYDTIQEVNTRLTAIEDILGQILKILKIESMSE